MTFKGFATRVQYKEESAYGVQAGAVDTVISGKVKNFNPDLNNTLTRTQGMGEGRNETQTLIGNFDIKWSMDIECATDIPTFLEFLIGTKAGSGTTAAPWYLEEADRVAYTGSPVLGSFKMEVGSEAGTVDDVDTYFGCIMNKATFNFAINTSLTVSIEGFAKIPISGTTTTAYTANTDLVYMSQQANFKWNGSIVARVQSGNLVIDNKFDPDENRGLGSRFLLEPQPNERTYDWTIVVKMTATIATTLRNHFYGQVNTPIDGVLNSELTQYALILPFSEGAATGDKNINILLSENSIDSISKPVSIGGGLVEATITGHGKKGTTDTSNKPIKWWTAT